MATRVTSELVGIKEDVVNKLFNVAPHRHAFINSIKKGTCTNNLVQWETDTDRTAVTTAAQDFKVPVEADYLSSSPTLLNNQVERLETFVAVSDKSISMDTYGNSSAFNYQVDKAVKSIKDGMETNMVGTAQSAVAASGVTTAGRAANFRHFVTTNTQAGSVGTAATSKLAISDIDALMEKIWKVSSVEGNYNLLVTPKIKRVISGLLDNKSNVRRDLGFSGKKVNSAFSGYMGDFGDVAIMPSQFLPTSANVAFLYNPSMFEHTTLKGFNPKITKLSKDGRRERALVDTAYTLKSFNQLASGVLTGLGDNA